MAGLAEILVLGYLDHPSNNVACCAAPTYYIPSKSDRIKVNNLE